MTAVIGICAVLERARWGYWDLPAHLMARNYVDAIQRQGAIVMILPPDRAVVADPDLVLDRLDGLVLAGGPDLDPACYGAQRHRETVDTVPERDEFELALCRRALARDLPLLGICRGMQILNVARGGTLIQHLPERLGHEQHRRFIGTFEGTDHSVRLQAGSLAARAAGATDHNTKSHHHQGVGEIGSDLLVTGWSTLDDLPEAIEDPSRRFALGVQWHPEADPASPLLGALVAAARGDSSGARAADASAG